MNLTKNLEEHSCEVSSLNYKLDKKLVLIHCKSNYRKVKTRK